MLSAGASESHGDMWDRSLAAAALAAYRIAGNLVAPLAPWYLARRTALGKEEGARSRERFGYPGHPRPRGALTWIHAASVGEALSILPLIEAVQHRWPALNLLLTTGTVSSSRVLAERLPGGVRHQYAPLDLMPCVHRFLDHWRPDVVLWVESEFWPNQLHEMHRRGIPIVLVNGRISSRSFARWRRVGPLIRHLLSRFSLVLAQAPEDEVYLRRLGAREVACLGNIKFAAQPLPCDEAELERVRARIGTRPVWLAASTHPGEEAIVATVHQQVGVRRADLVSVIVPRHPDRGPAIAATLEGSGRRVALRSEGREISEDVEIYIADTMGELGLWYRLCEIAFVGGSLVSHGGQNPIEPAKLDCAVLYGPHMNNFVRIAHDLEQCGAAVAVADGHALAVAIERLFAESRSRARMASAAKAYAARQDQVIEGLIEALAPFIVTELREE